MGRLSNPERDKRIERASHVCNWVFCVGLTLEILVALCVVGIIITISCTPQQEGVFDQRNPIADEAGHAFGLGQRADSQTADAGDGIDVNEVNGQIHGAVASIEPTVLSSVATNPDTVHLQVTVEIGTVPTNSNGGTLSPIESAKRASGALSLVDQTVSDEGLSPFGSPFDGLVIADDTTEAISHSDVVPPCTPFPRSDRDPCERRVPWAWPELGGARIIPHFIAPNPPHTIRQDMDDAYTRWTQIPHHIVRGVVMPGSTRCASHDSPVLTVDRPDSSFRRFANATDINCFSDLSIREYIVGSGPKRVTIITATRTNDHLSPDFGTVPRDADYFAGALSPVVEALEGYEWVFWLEVPLDPTRGVWDSSNYWSVQRKPDGQVVAVSRWSGWPGAADVPHQDRLELDIARYVAEARNAREHYDRLYSGKVDDSDAAPAVARDASRAALEEYHSTLGLEDLPSFVPLSPPVAEVPTDPLPDSERC